MRAGTGGRHGKMDPVLAEFFDDDQLEEEYGGTLTSFGGNSRRAAHARSKYDHARYWAAEAEYFSQWIAHKKELFPDAAPQ